MGKPSWTGAFCHPEAGCEPVRSLSLTARRGQLGSALCVRWG